jgi:hypothetical protein
VADTELLQMLTFLGLNACKVHRACAHFEVSTSSFEQLAWKSVGKSGYYAQGVGGLYSPPGIPPGIRLESRNSTGLITEFDIPAESTRNIMGIYVF